MDRKTPNPERWKDRVTEQVDWISSLSNDREFAKIASLIEIATQLNRLNDNLESIISPAVYNKEKADLRVSGIVGVERE